MDEWLRDKSYDTVIAYEGDLQRVADHFGAPSSHALLSALWRLSREEANFQVLKLRNDMLEAELSPSSVNRTLSSLRSITRLAHSMGAVDWVLDVKGVKTQAYRDTRGPGAEAYRRMLEIADDGSPRGVRNVAILRLLHDRALRRGEVVKLDVEDVEEKAIWVMGKGKREKERLTISWKASEAIDSWLDLRGSEPGPLFVRLDNAAKGYKRLTGRGVHKIVATIGLRAGAGAVWPHGLRHTAITSALDKFSIRDVQKFSRHAKIETVTVYDDNLTDVGGDISESIA